MENNKMTQDIRDSIQRELSDLTSRRIVKLSDKQLLDHESKLKWKPDMVEEIYKYYLNNGRQNTCSKFDITLSQFREIFKRYPNYNLKHVRPNEQIIKRNDTLIMGYKEWLHKYNHTNEGMYYKYKKNAIKLCGLENL